MDPKGHLAINLKKNTKPTVNKPQGNRATLNKHKSTPKTNLNNLTQPSIDFKLTLNKREPPLQPTPSQPYINPKPTLHKPQTNPKETLNPVEIS